MNSLVVLLLTFFLVVGQAQERTTAKRIERTAEKNERTTAGKFPVALGMVGLDLWHVGALLFISAMFVVTNS